MMRKGISIIALTIIVIGLIFFFLRESDRKDLSGDQISERIPALVASEELILELTKGAQRNYPGSKEFQRTNFRFSFLKKLAFVWTSDVDFFDSASLKIVKGEFLSESQDDYVAEVAFHAVVRTESKKWKERYSSYRVHWSRKEGQYEMADWTLIREVDKPEISRKYFRDRLVEALPDLSTRRRLTQSEHRRALSYHYSTNKKMVPTQDFEPIAMGLSQRFRWSTLITTGGTIFISWSVWGKICSCTIKVTELLWKRLLRLSFLSRAIPPAESLRILTMMGIRSHARKEYRANDLSRECRRSVSDRRTEKDGASFFSDFSRCGRL